MPSCRLHPTATADGISPRYRCKPAPPLNASDADPGDIGTSSSWDRSGRTPEHQHRSTTPVAARAAHTRSDGHRLDERGVPDVSVTVRVFTIGVCPRKSVSVRLIAVTVMRRWPPVRGGSPVFPNCQLRGCSGPSPADCVTSMPGGSRCTAPRPACDTQYPPDGSRV